jgi:hypothetical protein
MHTRTSHNLRAPRRQRRRPKMEMYSRPLLYQVLDSQQHPTSWLGTTEGEYFRCRHPCMPLFPPRRREKVNRYILFLEDAEGIINTNSLCRSKFQAPFAFSQHIIHHLYSQAGQTVVTCSINSSGSSSSCDCSPTIGCSATLSRDTTAGPLS